MQSSVIYSDIEARELGCGVRELGGGGLLKALLAWIGGLLETISDVECFNAVPQPTCVLMYSLQIVHTIFMHTHTML